MKWALACQILYGNLAPEGCVGKITGKEGLVFQGPARVFDCEEDMLAALSENPDSMKARPSARQHRRLLQARVNLMCAAPTGPPSVICTQMCLTSSPCSAAKKLANL